jgi:2-succinyl-5-enolpyruvyl-6-hydroxy-3-cyclohexene-1-carboxylate synthase
MTAYDLFLRGTRGTGQPPSWILQFGATPVSAALERYIARSGCPRVLVATGGDWQDPSRVAGRRILTDAVTLAEHLSSRVAEAAHADWLAAWQRADARGQALGNQPSLRPPEADVVAALEAGLAPGALLFVGNSMPVRALDVFARGRSAPLAVHGNRGLSGIDGNVSTALGLGRSAGARPTALLGDLTLYHDMNGLLATRDVPADLVVLDNGGGAIFGLLPQARLPDFERLWLTPTGLELERVAAVYDLDYVVIDEPQGLGPALAGAGDARLLHVRIDRETSTRRFRRLFEAATDLQGKV